MAYKRVDGYHSNKRTKSLYFDSNLEQREIRGSERLYGMEIELDFPEEKEIDCNLCDGFGEITEMIDCPHCDGCGSIEVTSETGELRTVECPDCNGSGSIEHTGNCPDCSGTGKVTIDYDFSDLQYVPDHLANTCVFESDGSLDNGFEIITEPMSYNGILEWLDNEWLDRALDESEDRDNAGVHIHVSRPNLTMLKKVIVFIAKNGSRLADLTRDSSYASFYPSDFEDTAGDYFKRLVMYLSELDHDIYDDDWSQWHPDAFEELNFEDITECFNERYMALNLTNSRTIEFRFFNYTRDPNRLKKYIRFLDGMFNLLETMTFAEVVKTDFYIQTLELITIKGNSDWDNKYTKDVTIHHTNSFHINNYVSTRFNRGWTVFYGQADSWGLSNENLFVSSSNYEHRKQFASHIKAGMLVRIDPYLVKMSQRLIEHNESLDAGGFGDAYLLVNEHSIQLSDLWYKRVMDKELFLVVENYGTTIDVIKLPESGSINLEALHGCSRKTFDVRWVNTAFDVETTTTTQVFDILKESEVL